jgi:hypothetical protein
MTYFDERLTASISTHIHIGPCTVLAGVVRTHEDGSPYVVLKIGDSDGGASVYLGPTELDRLIDTAVQARVDLATMTAVPVVFGTAERHDDPTHVDEAPGDASGPQLLHAEGWS